MKHIDEFIESVIQFKVIHDLQQADESVDSMRESNEAFNIVSFPLYQRLFEKCKDCSDDGFDSKSMLKEFSLDFELCRHKIQFLKENSCDVDLIKRNIPIVRMLDKKYQYRKCSTSCRDDRKLEGVNL